jgi:hypothetical protein
VDNDGNTLLVGALYWNDVLNAMYVWSGTVWVQIATTSVYTAPTLGTTTIGSGATVSNVDGLTINSTTIPTSKTLVATDTTDFVATAGGSTITVSSGSTVPLTIQNNGTGNSFVVNDVASDTTPFVIDAAGNVAIGGVTGAGQLLRLLGSSTGGTTTYGLNNIQSIQSDVTVNYVAFRSSVSTQAAAFTLSTLSHFQANQGTLGASSAVTNQYGFVAGSTVIGASFNYGFFGDMAASGSSRFNFYANGTAPNYFAGRTGIGGALSSGAMAGVFNTTAGDVGFIVRGAASQTGDLQQWQNSAGTVLAEVTAAGGFELNGKDIELMTIMQAL